MNILEIASTKAYTIGRRVEYKDYIDLYFVLKEQGVSLGDVIDLSNRKYGSKFNSRLFLEQLVDDSIEELPIKFIKNLYQRVRFLSFLKVWFLILNVIFNNFFPIF